jgi:hypothetical protein
MMLSSARARMLKFLKYVGEIGGITGAIMIALNSDAISAYGYIFFTASSFAWTIAATWMKEWSLMRMSLAFFAINVMGVYNWLI